MSKERINRLTSASLDLENSVRFLEELSNQEYGSLAYEALLIAAIIFYARPFSSNEKRGSPYPSESRVPDTVLSGLQGEERELHDKIICLRNKAVAHAEWGHHPAGVTSDGVIKAVPFSIWGYFKGNTDNEKFKALAAKVRLSVLHEQGNELRNLP